MIRVIKYNAWDTKRNKMWSAEELGKDELTLSPDGRGFVNISGINTKLSQYMKHLIPLQFTGLQDKNGKEIYEGDILEDEDGTYLVYNCRMGFEWLGLSGDYIKNSIYSGDWTIDITGMIIGNKYANPELLERERQL